MMKKMFFGAILTLWGFIGVIVLIALSVDHPWDYDNITGFRGFLLGSDTLWFFVLFCIMSLAGISITFYEAYVRKSE